MAAPVPIRSTYNHTLRATSHCQRGLTESWERRWVGKVVLCHAKG